MFDEQSCTSDKMIKLQNIKNNVMNKSCQSQLVLHVAGVIRERKLLDIDGSVMDDTVLSTNVDRFSM